MQLRLESAQDRLTALLTDAPTPIPLRSAVEAARDTRFLLITAGTVADERRAATDIQSAGRDRVVVWNVDGAEHVGGYRTQPDEWHRRVVGFLDENLG